jgi:hypothetical protein
MHCKSTKYIWDKLQNIYEGHDKVNKGNLQTHRRQFKSLKMKDEEIDAAYFIQVDEIVNTIKGIGEDVEESVIVQKVVRSLHLRFYFKVYSTKEIKDL